MAQARNIDRTADARAGEAKDVENHLHQRHGLIALAALAILTLAMFADVLFTATPRVLSNQYCDLFLQFIHWQSFAAGELKHGNLPLWNPHVFSGAPFLGESQAGLLYPLNLIYLFLPLDLAINWSIVLHIFLSGAFVYWWAAYRRLRPPAAFLASVLFIFCGAHFLRIYAGHLPHIRTLSWMPLIFLAIDGLRANPSLGWSLLGMFAMAMEVLAGSPQLVFYTGIAAGIYCALLLPTVANWKRFLPGAAGIAAGGVALSAVQLFTSYQEAPEMLRGVGVPYRFAAAFSFPPENFLTLLAPNFFGDMKTIPYWGRCYLWEMSLFFSVSGLVLAVIGSIYGERRMRWVSIVTVLLLLWLALGAHTPLFKLLYSCVPGFDKFRGSSKFVLPASLFLVLLAGTGFQELTQRLQMPRSLILGVGLAGLSLVVSAAWIKLSSAAGDGGWWHSVMVAIRNSSESYLPAQSFDDPVLMVQRGNMASHSLLLSGGTFLVVALLLWIIPRRPFAIWALLGLATVEPLIFARASLDTFDSRKAVNPEIKQLLDAHPGDYRILNLQNPNAALSMGAAEIWGLDPGILLRYAQFVAFAEGMDPDQTTQYIPFRRYSPLLGMLRCRYAFIPQRDGLAVHQLTNDLPHVLVIQHCQVLPRRDDIIQALTSPGFNPREAVILESQPDPLPAADAAAGTAKMVNASTDCLTIEADLSAPGILLITDAYAKGWQARALPGSAQAAYTVMPANYCLRAIPLSAGKHHLVLEYIPPGYRVGKWVSIVSAGIFLLLLFVGHWPRKAEYARRWNHAH